MIKPYITIACCVSNINVFNECVVQSLKHLRNDLEFDLLPIYNSHNVYTAAIAGNLSLEIAKSRYVMLIHQDLKFTDESGPNIVKLLSKMDNNRIISGFAGIDLSYGDDHIDEWGFSETNVKVGQVFGADTITWDGDTSIKPVHSLDEICLIIDKHSGIRFDPTLKGFHLYGLDICLQARSAGYQVIAGGVPIEHCGQYSSSLYIDHNFVGKIIALHEKWSPIFESVFMPYAHWHKNRIVSYVSYAMKNAANDIIDVSRIAIDLNDEHCISTSSK